jgi:ABC-type polysaccharide/polyol phosphate export permease
MTRITSDAVGRDLPHRRQSVGGVGLLRAGIADLISRRRLIRYLVRADLKRTHADTIIGQLWWIVDPILQVGVYFLVFDLIFHRKTPDFLLYLLAAILPWKWFNSVLNNAMSSVVGRQGLIRQVPFPKLVLPTSATLAGTVSFTIGLSALVLVYPLYLGRLTPWVLLLPVVAFVQLVFSLAIAIALSAANSFYRDVSNVTGHVLRLLFYMSPILYTVDDLPTNPTARFLFSLNPFTTLMTAYRDIIWGTATGPGRAPDFVGLGVLLAVSFVLLAIAIAIFKRVEPALARIL